MTLLIIVLITAFFAGLIQGVTGFGAGIVMMSAIPYVINLPKAAAITNAVAVVLTIIMAYQYRNQIKLKLLLAPTLFYIIGSTLAIHLSKGYDSRFLKIIFAVFLIGLALYFWKFAEKVSIKANFLTMFLCGVVSGICDGLFAIGGPLMVLFFLAVTDSQEEYLANLQTVFLISGLYNLFFRAIQGILTVDLLPLIVLGIISIIIGLVIANRIMHHIKPTQIKLMTYALIGISGLFTLMTTII